MPSKSPRQSLIDIIENIEFAHELCARLSIDDFAIDRAAFYATTRCLEIISEASRRLPPEMQARHSAINSRAVAGAGNVYRHDYPAIEPRQVWTTVRTQLGALEAAVRQELAALSDASE